ncbi:MAG TPA: translation initiation factor IF-3 [Tepidisphaeraceae bacterium]|jgi:translation initiation factor IF-3|nr:translation initiation factor IF-3 [Tepidisphaeraceae bacterium]
MHDSRRWIATEPVGGLGVISRCRSQDRILSASRFGMFLQEIKTISTNFRHNEQIRISPIRLINDKEEQVGIVSTAEALRMAREAALDLVEVAPTARPPVCRIMDYGKWRYQQQKKEDKSRASSRAGRLKQINIDTIRIGDHDLEIKINRAKDFLKEGNKVQFTLRFKGREMAHLDLGRVLFVKIKTELFLVSKVERDAKMEGKRMTLVLQPDHKDPSKLKEVQQPAAPVRAGSGLNIPIGAARPGATPAGSLPPAGGAGPMSPRPAVVGAPVATRPAASAPVAPRPAAASAPRPVPAPVNT